MMKLSHESKVRLGVGIGAFVLIIGLVFGTSRLLTHSDRSVGSDRCSIRPFVWYGRYV